MKFLDIENTDKSYIDLIEEIEKQQKSVDKAIIYMLVGLIARDELSVQEYKVFIDRVLNKKKFSDIAFQLSLSQSSVKTYYSRSLKKLNKVAISTELQFYRKS
jgi:FixJ family two-component response regulator